MPICAGEITLNIGNIIYGLGISGTGGVISPAQIGIGTQTPAAGSLLDINGTGVNFSAMVVPRDTTVNRPNPGVNGMIRYNTNLASLEVYANNNWVTLSAADNLG